MGFNSGGIIVFLIDSYIGMVISISVFCISLGVLIVKRKTLKFSAKIIFIFLAVLFFAFVCLSIYFSISFGKYNQKVKTGVHETMDNQSEASNILWTLDNDKIISSKISGKIIKNDIEYKNVIMTIFFEDSNFIFEIYDNKQSPFINNAAYQIDYGEIKYEKGIAAENNVLEIEEDILAPFLLADEIFTVAFFDVLDDKTGNYVFKLKGNNFLDLWSQMNGKEYKHLPVWETAPLP